MGAAPLGSLTGAAAEPPTDAPLTEAPWSLEPGATIEPYQRPSRFEKDVVRTLLGARIASAQASSAQVALTPHHLVNGTIPRTVCIS